MRTNPRVREAKFPRYLFDTDMLVFGVRNCKFCDNPASSREHTIADWILQKIDIQDEIRRVVGKSRLSGSITFRILESRVFALLATMGG